jgi:hypothetical protein
MAKAGGWRLGAGGWRLEAGGWTKDLRLEAGGEYLLYMVAFYAVYLFPFNFRLLRHIVSL